MIPRVKTLGYDVIELLSMCKCTSQFLVPNFLQYRMKSSIKTTCIGYKEKIFVN